MPFARYSECMGGGGAHQHASAPAITNPWGLMMGAWPEPLDSKSAVRRAGQNIRAGTYDLGDLATLNRWRAAHGYIINTFQAAFRGRTAGKSIPVAQRLKRAATIIDKLSQGRALDLASMHDIAGVRLVFPDVETLHAFRDGVHRTRAKHEMANAPDRYNYLTSPKDSGYRGIHDIYRYQAGTANGAKWNGLLIEIQYRTIVQHAWATAVELSDALTANRTKFSQGSADNERFFKICSELLARRFEGHVSCLPDASHADLVAEWQDIESRAHLFQHLRDAWEQSGGGGDFKGFVLLIVQGTGDLRVEMQRSYRGALDRLLFLEEEHPDWDIVLVSGENESLRSAFRNYFRNATEFVTMMDTALTA